MKHQQFEDWLISEEQLSDEEERLLKEHLIDCSDCRLLQLAFTSIEEELTSAPMAAPPEGFVRRFDSRLEKRLKRERRRQSMIVLGIGSLLAAASLILLLRSIDFASIPYAEMLASFLAFFTTLAAYFTKMFDIGLTLLGVVFGAAIKVNWLNTILVLISLIAFRFSSTSLRTSRKGVSYE